MAAEPVSPVETSTAVAQIIAPPPTLTPTTPPTPTQTPERRPQSTQVQQQVRTSPPAEPEVLSAGLLSIAGTTICAGGAVLLILGVLVAGLVWLYRLGWGDVNDDEFADEEDDYSGEEIVVEIVED
jgi:hypothetical protein